MHAPPPDKAPFTAYAIPLMGVIAALALIGVSAALNWSFGFQLGRTPVDGQIYGVASVAADIFKCLSPFFFFYAVRNRMWSHAAAAALVGLVTFAYSLTSATGHAALNRMDTTGQRAVQATSYKDARGDLKRAEEQLSWVPQHRPAATVQAEIDVQKTQRMWTWTGGCNAAQTNSSSARTFCSNVHKLEAEKASAEEAAKLEERIQGIKSRLGSNGAVMADADPQASVLSRLTGISIDKVQVGLMLAIVVLLEICSTFGLYVATSTFPDRPRRQKKLAETVRHAANDAVAIPATSIIPFPRAASPVSSLDGAVSASAVLGATVVPVTQAESAVEEEDDDITRDEARKDLNDLVDAHGVVPAAQILADRWGVAKSTVHKWVKEWPEFERVGETKPYQAKAIVRKGAAEAAA